MTDFPIDWREWDSAFKNWHTNHTELKRTPSPFPKKNMLASDVYVFTAPTGIVELSEVTFPDFGSGSMETKFRRVGITWWVDGECWNGGLVSSFEELDQAIKDGPPHDEK